MSDDDMLPVVHAADLAEQTAASSWLVESLWARAGVGILGGAPKCCKSWLGLDLALSVATGTPALDAFDVDDAGPVLLYMAEDAAPIVKARLLGLCAHRGLSLGDAPLHVVTAPSLRLDRVPDQVRLRDAARRLRPRLLLLDPFVRLHRIDENDSGQVAALLGYLRELQRELDLAVVVVHHARKNGSAVQPGQSLRGSGDLHAWGDSNLYMRRTKDALALTVEHRAAAAVEPISLALVDNDGHPRLTVVDAPDAPASAALALDARVLEALRAAPLARTSLRDVLRVRNERLGEALTRLAEAGAVMRIGERWGVPVPTLHQGGGTERGPAAVPVPTPDIEGGTER
jgi:AAA domain